MFPQLGMMEMVVVMGVAVLLFGKRLPEVGRSLGKGIIEFKKGLKGIEDEFDFSTTVSPSSSSSRVPAKRTDDRLHDDAIAGAAVPKFEPPTAAPVPHFETEPQPMQD